MHWKSFVLGIPNREILAPPLPYIYVDGHVVQLPTGATLELQKEKAIGLPAVSQLLCNNIIVLD